MIRRLVPCALKRFCHRDYIPQVRMSAREEIHVRRWITPVCGAHFLLVLLVITVCNDVGCSAFTYQSHIGEKNRMMSRCLLSTGAQTSEHASIMEKLKPIIVCHEKMDGVSRLSRYVRNASRVERRRALTSENVISVLSFLSREFSAEAVRHIVLSCPRILRRDVDTQLKPTVSFLSNLYGKERLDGCIRTNASLLLIRGIGYHNHNNGSVEVEHFLADELLLPSSQINQLKLKKPRIFQFNVKNMRRVFHFLTEILLDYDADVPSEKKMKIMRKIIVSDPYLFSCNVESNLRPTVDFLKDQCCMDAKAVATLVRSCPGELGLSTERNLQAKLEFFRERVGMEEDVDLARCMRRHPQILGLSISNLQEKVSYFDEIDRISGTDGERLAHRVAIGQPSTYSLSLTKNIIPTVTCLANMWGLADLLPSSFNHPQKRAIRTMESRRIVHSDLSLAKLLGEYPPIFSTSLEGNIKPTINFFNATGHLSLDNEGCAIRSKKKDISLMRTRYLAASLYNRLLPRWQFLKEYIFEKSCERNLPPLYILIASDAKFCSYFGVEISSYLAFKSEVLPTLKFSSQFVNWIKTGRPIDNT